MLEINDNVVITGKKKIKWNALMEQYLNERGVIIFIDKPHRIGNNYMIKFLDGNTVDFDKKDLKKII